MRIRGLIIGLAAVAALTASAQTGLYVEAGPKAPVDSADRAMRTFGRNAALLTEAARKNMAKSGQFSTKIPFSLPTTVHLTSKGRLLERRNLAPGNITLVFDAAGTRAFPQTYRDLLQSVFDTAKPTLDIIFGQASEAGPVLVKNYDADIGDRDAVAGGFFIPNNGSGGREIRFPIYVSPEAASVNFIHTLLLAYLGPNSYGFDAFQEGIVRAAVMKVARTNGALPASLDPGLIDLTLQNTYDVGSSYDWFNQRALGGPQFIAPNLRDVPLPAGGSLGGIYLLRYQMAGSAWQKLVAENPGFIREFNRRYYLSPGISSNVPALVAIGQQALDTVTGVANSKIEGFSFAEWFRRQYILETKLTLGRKLLVQPVPITTNLGGDDFGVYDISATYFETQPAGNENLLSGTSFPIFWDQAFNRVFSNTQDERIDIAGAYGSVTPNLPDINSAQPYRCTVDIPVGDKLARAYLPVGSIATAADPDEKNFYGTVTGQSLNGGTLQVKAYIGTTLLGTALVRNFAFGIKYTQAAFAGYARLKVDVLRNGTIVHTRFVNKGPGPLAVDLRVNETTLNVPLLKGIQMIGIPTQPFASAAGDILGVAENQVQLARYNASDAAYELYPDSGSIEQGGGYFIRRETAGTIQVPGSNPVVPMSVALRPGWNMISNPLNEITTTSRIQVVRTTEFPKLYSEAVGLDIDDLIFAFQRGAPDIVTGAPETGGYVAATQFEPGKAYFVRCLAPEGATMVFFPAATQLRVGRVKVQTGWRMQATLSDSRVNAPVLFGRSNSGTSALDREDGPMPPRFTGGLYATMESGPVDLYRDVKNMYGQEQFSMRLEGLKPGTYYTIKFNPVRGGSRRFDIRDYYEFVSTVITAPATYRFRATKASHKFIITEVR